MRKLLFTFLLLAFGASLSMAQGIKFQEGQNLKQVYQLSQKENKLIFLDAYATWCGPCKMLSNRVFPDASVGSFFNKHFVNYAMDMEKGEGPKFAQKYALEAFPTLYFLDSNGKVVHAIVGYHNAEQLLAEGQKALEKFQSKKY